MARKFFDNGSLKALYFIIGVILNLISIINFNQYQILAIIGILVGIFFIVKSLS
mgnify:CR=1 FL=1